LPEVPGCASRRWLAEREAELLPVPYFHVVYTLPCECVISPTQNKRVVIYDLLMKAAARRPLAIAADPKRLGARIVSTAVLHSWGSALTHHPHVHMIVPGGDGSSFDSTRWVASARQLPRHINVGAPCSAQLAGHAHGAHDANQLTFQHPCRTCRQEDVQAFFIRPAGRRNQMVVYCKAPFAGPGRCCAISHVTPIGSPSRTAASLQADDGAIAFRWKDYRVMSGRWKTMRLHPHEFIKAFPDPRAA